MERSFSRQAELQTQVNVRLDIYIVSAQHVKQERRREEKRYRDVGNLLEPTKQRPKTSSDAVVTFRRAGRRLTLTSKKHTPRSIGGTEEAMGACCRLQEAPRGPPEAVHAARWAHAAVVYKEAHSHMLLMSNPAGIGKYPPISKNATIDRDFRLEEGGQDRGHQS